MTDSFNEEWLLSFLQKHHLSNRVSVSPDTNRVVEDLYDHYDQGQIHEVDSGEEVLTWIIPQQWTVNEAWVETMDGNRIIDYENHPLHLRSYSSSFEGTISREKLREKTMTLPNKKELIPYHYGWQFDHSVSAKWGFCASHETMKQLEEDRYRVKIHTEFKDGVMKFLDWHLPGKKEETIFFAAHTCHPGQVNDGLACVGLLAELFHQLSQKKNRKYSYRFIAGPEYFTAATFLHSFEHEFVGGVFLDRPGFEEPLGFSSSYQGNSYFDQAMEVVFEESLDFYQHLGYREVAGNDELFYDGPDFEIPTLPVARPYSDFTHTSGDNFLNTNFEKLKATYCILERFVELLEVDYIPQRQYQGNLYFSRFGFSEIINSLRRKSNDQDILQKLQMAMDGEASLVEISHALGIEFSDIYSFLKALREADLAEIKSEVPDEITERM